MPLATYRKRVTRVYDAAGNMIEKHEGDFSRVLGQIQPAFTIWSNCRSHRVSKFSQIVEHGKNKTRGLSVSDNVLRRFTRQNQQIS